MSEKWERWSGIALNVVSVCGALGGIIAAIGILWLQSEFLPRTEFDSYRDQNQAQMAEQGKSIAGIERTLAVIAEKLLNDTRQDARIESLDNRVRDLERGKR